MEICMTSISLVHQIRNATIPSPNPKNLGTKEVFRGKMCSKVFNAMNNFWTAHFSLFMIDAWKCKFTSIIFIYAAFIHKSKVSSKILSEKLATYRWFYILYIFHFQHCLRNNMAVAIFGRVNIYFYLTPKAYEKTNTLTYIMLKLVGKCAGYCHFS